MRRILKAACLPAVALLAGVQRRPDHSRGEGRRPRPVHGRLVRDRQHPDAVRGGRAQRGRVVPARPGRQHRDDLHLIATGRSMAPEKVMRPRGFVRDGTGNAVWGMQFVWPIKAEYLIAYVDPGVHADDHCAQRAGLRLDHGAYSELSADEYARLERRVRDLGYDVAQAPASAAALGRCHRLVAGEMNDAIPLEGRATLMTRNVQSRRHCRVTPARLSCDFASAMPGCAGLTPSRRTLAALLIAGAMSFASCRSRQRANPLRQRRLAPQLRSRP